MASPVSVIVPWHGLDLEVTGDYQPARPGHYSGPPEACYPDEPGEFSLTSIRLDEQELPLELFEGLSCGKVPFLSYLSLEALSQYEDWLHSDARSQAEDQARERARDRELGL